MRSVGGATALIGIVGVSWALTLWAPFAIISAEISKLEEVRRLRASSPDDNNNNNTTDQAGIVLGIHNMSVSSPQIFATVGSSIIFKFLQKPRGTPGDHSIAVVLAAGGLSTLVAAFLTSRIQDEVEIPEGVVVEEGLVSGRENGGLSEEAGSFSNGNQSGSGRES